MSISINENRLSVHRELLSRAFSQSLRRYQDFLALCAVEDVKDYAGHQAACKAAIAHMEALIKLINAMEARTDAVPLSEKGTEVLSIETLLADARAEINQLQRNEKHPPQPSGGTGG